MKNIKKLLLIPIVVIACMFTRIDSLHAVTVSGVTYPFSVTTTSISSGGVFKFVLYPKGTFYVDCGDGGTLSGTGVSGGQITRSSALNYVDSKDTYTCTYSTAGVKTIQFGGQTTQYDSYSYGSPTISFGADGMTPTLVASVSGDLSTIFPFKGTGMGKTPCLCSTFANCSNLHSVPDTLFSGYTTGSDNLFNGTFSGSGITSIPENLFQNLTSATSSTFGGTFSGCSGLTSIPGNLFNNITTFKSSAFIRTFSGCTGLTSLPGNLFNNVTSGGADMFLNTFSGCTGLTSLPGNLFSHITTGVEELFNGTFQGCTGLTSLPENLFGTITTSGRSMFVYTFRNCTGLTSIPGNLFSSMTVNANAVFYHTFEGCTGLTSIPGNLFNNVTTGRNSTFAYTFKGCTGLTSIPGNLFSHITSIDSGATYTFYNVFADCTGLTSLPENLFSTVTSGGFYLFQNAFSGCTNLSSYIPPSMFSGLIANGSRYWQDMMKDIFLDTNLYESCPPGMAQYVTGYEKYWNSKVSCAQAYSCSSGKYLPANSTTCASCPSGYTCSGGSWLLNPTNDQGKTPNSYNVTYSCGSGSGSAPAATTATYTQSFTPASNTCTHPGGTYGSFSGWWVSGTSDVIPAGSAVTWNYIGNKTLTAKYVGNSVINMTFDGESPSACMLGSTFVPPTPPARTGYVFAGWKIKTITAAPPYTQVQYLTSTGSQYINTNTYFNASQDFRIVGDVINPSTSYRKVIAGNWNGDSSVQYTVEFGGSSNSKPGYFRNYLSNSSSTTDKWANSASPANTVISYDSNYTASNHTISNSITANGSTQTYSFSTVSLSGSATRPFRLFLDYRSSSSSIAYPLSIGRTKMYKAGSLVADYVPARRTDDEVLGMYDTVSGNFYTNAGTGTFTAGPDVGPLGN